MRSASTTHAGLIRTANEDSILVREAERVWLVADGMGGHANGQWASQMVARAVGDAHLSRDFDAATTALADALHAANGLIWSAAQSRGASMGSTAVLLTIRDGRFACLWAGDSRAYLLREGQLHRVSRDHTQVQEMVDRGLLTPTEAANHPMGHVLSRAVGVQESLALDAVTDAVQPRDIFLLCSDGLSGVVSEAEMTDRLASFPGPVALKRLEELVLSRGAPDNVSMIAVACEEATALVLGFGVPA